MTESLVREGEAATRVRQDPGVRGGVRHGSGAPHGAATTGAVGALPVPRLQLLLDGGYGRPSTWAVTENYTGNLLISLTSPSAFLNRCGYRALTGRQDAGDAVFAPSAVLAHAGLGADARPGLTRCGGGLPRYCRLLDANGAHALGLGQVEAAPGADVGEALLFGEPALGVGGGLSRQEQRTDGADQGQRLAGAQDGERLLDCEDGRGHGDPFRFCRLTSAGWGEPARARAPGWKVRCSSMGTTGEAHWRSSRTAPRKTRPGK